MPTRRDFIATAAASIAAPSVLGRAFVLGSGEFTVEITHDWLRAPTGIAFGDTHGLAQAKDGRIFVAHTVHASSDKPDAVCVFDDKGTFITSWGADFRGGAHGLDIREEDGTEFLYHCDTRRSVVVKTDLEGALVWQKGVPEEVEAYRSGKRYVPTNVAFAPDGDLFVGDGYGSSYIHRFGADGTYKATIVGPGAAEGQVNCPHGLWVDDRGAEPSLLVADRSNRRLQSFTLDGTHRGFVTDGIRRPCHLKTRGEHLLIPDLESVITVLDGKNKVVAHIGDGHPTNLRGAPRDQFVEGRFVHPHDAIFLHNGDILVAEWVPIGRVTLLKRV